MNGESSKSDNVLDIQGKGNHLWLVKVPKHLAEKWLSAEGGQNVGKLAINKWFVYFSKIFLCLNLKFF